MQNKEKLTALLEKLKKNLLKTNFDRVVKFNCNSKAAKATMAPVEKTLLMKLYRSILHLVVPKEMMPTLRFRKQFVRNVFVLVTAGKKYPVMVGHLMKNLNCDDVTWLRRFLSS